jgi:uncharacterized protein (TIGR03437 family)
VFDKHWPFQCCRHSVRPQCLSVAALVCMILPAALAAQLITNPQTIPHTGNPPVIFLNGFQLDCGSASFAKDFGIADQVLQANSRATLFFNNCTVSGSPSIEALGNAFGSFLATLTYDDGQPVTTVDAVGYSMGGLILRSYLSGKQVTQGVFTPPAAIPIRKAVFIATPHFGSPVGALAFGTSVQADELSSGSHFLMDLNTWNQNHDDLRGIDAMAIAGNGGTGLAVSPGFDDGLVALSSASLRFYKPGVTRVLPLCHSANGIPSQLGLCPSNAKSVAKVLAATDDNARILVSFLAGTPEWQTIGTAIEQTSSLQQGSGVIVRARTATDQTILPSSITATKKLNMSNSEIAWTDLLPSGLVNFAVSAGTQSFSKSVNVIPGGAQAIVVKPGPSIDVVIPAAALVSPLVVAPRMIISLYGTALDQASVSVNSVNVNNEPLAMLYNGSQQINAVLPADLPVGLVKLQVQNPAGSQTINLYVEPAYPAVFTLGNNTAAAVDANTGQIVTATTPLRPGDYVELYLTGLGVTSRSNGFDVASVQPTVTIAGVNCPVTYAGAAPGFAGLDQINCIVSSALSASTAASVVVTSGLRSSPATTVAVGP